METGSYKKLSENICSLPPVPPEALARFQKLHPKLVIFMHEKLALESYFLPQAPPPPKALFLKEMTRLFCDMLLGAYEFNLFCRLSDEMAWFVSVMEHRGYTRQLIEKIFHVWNIAVNSFLPPADAAEMLRPLSLLQRNLALLYEHGSAEAPPLPPDLNAFLELLLAKKKDAGIAFLMNMLHGGTSCESILTEFIPTVMSRVGTLWQNNTISVIEQHVATDICSYMLFKLEDECKSKERLPFTALVTCAPGDIHEMGAEALECYLTINGWDMHCMGHIAPHNAILQAVCALKPDVVFLAVSMIAHLPEARMLAREVRTLLPSAKIVMGGHGAAAAGGQLSSCADAVANSFSEAHKKALELVGHHA